MIQSPVYAPFYSCINENNRTLVDNPLIIRDNRLEINFEDFENKLKDGVKLFILCSPHNPGGMVWNKADITRMAELCKEYDVLIISDEIHADLNLYGNEHTPIAKLNPNSITLMAPSKTFNIAGLQASLAIAENPEIMKKLTVSQMQMVEIAKAVSYNSKVIKTESLPTEINPYSSPLDRIWEIEFAG